MSRLQSAQVCLSLRIIHGFSQWQIVGLQKCAFHNFSPKARSVTQGSGNVTIHTRDTMLCCTLDTDNATLSCKKSWRCSDPRKMLGFSLFTWTALSCISGRGMPAGLSQEPEFLDVRNPSYQINVDPSTPNDRYLTHFWLWRVMNYEEENWISSPKTTSDPRAVTCFRQVISLTIKMHHIVLFLKKVLQDPYPSEGHWKRAVQSLQVMMWTINGP